MDDEPLKDWAERRDAKIGRLRAVPVVSGDGPRASHLQPDAPRAIERGNGHAWEPHGFAANLAEAKAVLYPEARESSNPPYGPVPKPLGSGTGTGTGKHRKPPAPQVGQWWSGAVVISAAETEDLVEARRRGALR